MSHRVRIASSFKRDLRAQVAWLRRIEQSNWVEALGTALDEAMTLLSEQPRVGAIEARSRGGSTLRKLILRRVPYVIWYGVAGSRSGSDVWLIRLFHARQRRPTPHWPARVRG